MFAQHALRQFMASHAAALPSLVETQGKLIGPLDRWHCYFDWCACGLLRGRFCGFELAKVRTGRVLERELTVPVSEYGGRYSQRTFVAFDSRRMDDTVEHPQRSLRSVLRLASVFLPWHKSPRMHATLGGFMHSPTWGVGY